MDPLKEVQVVDPLTVKMILNEPNGIGWRSSPDKTGGHRLEACQGARAERLAYGGTRTTSEEWLNQTRPGRAFHVEELAQKHWITFERNPNYWGKAPQFSKVEIRDVTLAGNAEAPGGERRRGCRLERSRPTSLRTMRGQQERQDHHPRQSLDDMYLG